LQTVLDILPGFPAPSQRGYDNVLFSGTPRIPWARITLSTVNGAPFSLDGSNHMETGTFLVCLYYPPGNGTAAIEAMADAVAAAYRASLILTHGSARVMITSVRRNPLLPEADTIGAPVTVFWRALTSP
jgi:hypothetical protein